MLKGLAWMCIILKRSPTKLETPNVATHEPSRLMTVLTMHRNWDACSAAGTPLATEEFMCVSRKTKASILGMHAHVLPSFQTPLYSGECDAVESCDLQFTASQVLHDSLAMKLTHIVQR